MSLTDSSEWKLFFFLVQFPTSPYPFFLSFLIPLNKRCQPFLSPPSRLHYCSPVQLQLALLRLVSATAADRLAPRFYPATHYYYTSSKTYLYIYVAYKKNANYTMSDGVAWPGERPQVAPRPRCLDHPFLLMPRFTHKNTIKFLKISSVWPSAEYL